MNIKNELKKCREVLEYLIKLKGKIPRDNDSLEYDLNLLIEQYYLFYLVCERLLNNMSILRRDRNGPHWARRYHQKYSRNEKKVAEKAKVARKYYLLDENDFFIHTRILLDRYAKLSKYFFTNSDKPSPHSFRKHREFFKNDDNYKKISKHKKYASYIRNNTDWFDLFLKKIRDENIVHAHGRFMRGSGFSDSGEFSVFILPYNNNAKPVHVNVCDLIRFVVEFSSFFNKYMGESF